MVVKWWSNGCQSGSKWKEMTENQAENSVFRILDAAINRAAEGLRVVEDYLRMVISDAHLSSQLKNLRHDLIEATSSIDTEKRIAARDSQQDVGRQIQNESEYKREPIEGNNNTLVQANLARAQQAFRSIEEFSKTIDVDVAKKIEQIRYRTYTLEKSILTTVLSLRNLAESKLYVLVDSQLSEEDDHQEDRDYSNLEKLVRQLVDAKVSIIQLRDKRLNARELVAAGKAIAKITRGTETRFVMNDRADVALAAGADGVHVGQEDLMVADARRIMGAARLVGVSTHSIEQARQAVLDGANYIGVGPVFPSKTKSFKAPVGLELVEQVAKEIQLPAFAIGGINLENVGQVVDAGMTRVAVSAAVAKATDPSAAVASLLAKLAVG